MTALIDMAFLLITFFVMSIRFGQAGEEEIELPKADQAKEVSDQRVELVIVNITRDGTYMLNTVRRSSSDLRRYLKERSDNSSRTLEVVLRGDRETPFEAIQRAMRISVEAGITEVGLAALQMGEDEP